MQRGPIQSTVTNSAMLSSIAAFFDYIHGPLSVVILILSGIWICMQIYGWISDRRKK